MKYIKASATISHCGKFRYELTREWRQDAKCCMFIMLNPSTADGDQDDPTIKKCVGFADRLGYGRLQVFNLWAYRATNPADLKRAGYPMGIDNWGFLVYGMEATLDTGSHIICAWGANARGSTHAHNVGIKLGLERRAPLYALRELRDGTPEHPLMLPYSCQPKVYAPWL